MNTSEILTERADLESAQEICKSIIDEDIRNRSVANVFAANVASKFFDTENYSIDIESGLHNIPVVLNDIDISDIYINNSYIDVRLSFENDKLSIPLNIQNNLQPTAYMFIKISTDLASAEVLGFIIPDDIDRSKALDNSVIIDESDLVSFYDIEPLLSNISNDYIEVDDAEIFAYLDNSLTNKEEFFGKLVKSKEARYRLAKASKAQHIFNFVSISADNVSSSDNTSITSDPEEDFTQIQSDIDNIDFSINTDASNLELLDTTSEDLGLEEIYDTDTLTEVEPEDSLVLDNSDSMDVELEEHEIQNDNLILDDIDTNPLESENIIQENNVDDIITSELNAIEDNVEPEDNDFYKEIAQDSNVIEENHLLEEFAENNNDFDFKTHTTPSLDSNIVEEDNTFKELLDESNSENDIIENQQVDNTNEQIDKEAQLDSLFDDKTSEVNSNPDEQDEFEENNINITKKKNSSKLLPIIGIVAIVGGLGYLGYTKIFQAKSLEESLPENNIVTNADNSIRNNEDSAMPNETVETKVNNTVNNNEGNSISVPAIEQNLDASILVSNLKVDWEVPSGYVTNNSAKRYLVKLGKIIQLNLKTELLLLNKPPITNKIAVEIKYNKSAKKFEPVGITISSGEQSVDDLILKTVGNALALNISLNADSFSKLQGNPVLVIHL